MQAFSTIICAAMMSIAFSTAAQTTRYEGMCDASAAVSLGRDYFVVGDDEQNVLYVYRIGDPKWQGRRDLNKYLGAEREGKKPRETDVEAAARIGDRIYWITSHGRDGDGKAAPGRQRFFATTVKADAAPPEIRELETPPYLKMLETAINDARFVDLKKAEPFAPEEIEGLSIEGLAATPEGHLLIGFRNPRPRGAALILPLLNPAEVIDKGTTPAFGELIRLDLGGRGIRSLDRVADGYLIVGGPHDDRRINPRALSFALYQWAGAGHKPQQVSQQSFAGLNPEALIELPEGRRYVLSDDGDVMVGDSKCKKASADQQGFRGRYLD